METKNPKDFVLKKFSELDYASSFIINPQGVGGGLALFWKKEVLLTVKEGSRNFIDTCLQLDKEPVHVTFVYGEPEKAKRKDLWNLLSTKHIDPNQSWMLTGDFNELVDISEKVGGPIRPEGSFCDFRSFLNGNDLYDLQHTGNSLSWRGTRHTHIVLCRLDRVLINCAWAERYPASYCEYLSFEGSDHRPVITRLEPPRKRKGKLFRYDRSLLGNPDVKNLVASAWYSNRPCTVKNQIDSCRLSISKWMKENHLNNQKKIQDLKRKLEDLMSSPTGSESEIKKINCELKTVYQREELYWKQRSRVLWLSLGDKNSHFFSLNNKGQTYYK